MLKEKVHDMKSIAISIALSFMGIATLAAAEDNQELSQLRYLSDSLHSIGKTDSAVIIGQQAITLAEKCGELTHIVGTNAAQGVYLRSLGRIDEALKRYNAAMEIATSEEFRENPGQEAIEETASLYINMAVLSLDMQQKEEAKRNACLAAEWASKSNDAELRSTVRGVAGSVLTGCGELEMAMPYQSMAYEDALTAKDNEAAFRAASYTLLTATRLGKKEEAELWRKKCQSLLPEVNSTMARLVYYQTECSISLMGDNKREALKWFDKILQLDGIDNLPFVKYDCYNNMHLTYASMQEYDKAYNTLLVSNALRDSLMEQEKSRSLSELTVKYQTKEAELALMESKAQQTTILMWLFATIGLLMMGAIFFVMYANRQRRLQTEKEMDFMNLRADIGKRLTEQYLAGLEEERTRVAQELHDGICNDLLAVQMHLPPKEATMLNTCRESLRRISHQLMPPEFAYANLDEVVRYFIDNQPDSLHAASPMITYSSVGTEWDSVPNSIALEIYRIVQEAVGNAIKAPHCTQVDVMMALDYRNLELTIYNNGDYAAGKKHGIGMDSMRRRANAIGGELNIQHDVDKGTTLSLQVLF